MDFQWIISARLKESDWGFFPQDKESRHTCRWISWSHVFTAYIYRKQPCDSCACSALLCVCVFIRKRDDYSYQNRWHPHSYIHLIKYLPFEIWNELPTTHCLLCWTHTLLANTARVKLHQHSIWLIVFMPAGTHQSISFMQSHVENGTKPVWVCCQVWSDLSKVFLWHQTMKITRGETHFRC